MKNDVFTVALALAVCLAGCQPPVRTAADRNARNIDRLRNCIETYTDFHNNVGPKNKKELLDYLTTDPGALLRMKRRGVDVNQLEDMFISERDGQPFKIRWGLNGFYDHATVFEAEGFEGKREIALMKSIEVEDDNVYEDYWNGKIKPLPRGPRGSLDNFVPEETTIVPEAESL